MTCALSSVLTQFQSLCSREITLVSTQQHLSDLSIWSSTMSTDLVPGKYQLTESDNFENFMARLGIGYLTR